MASKDECKAECEKYDWCKGLRIKENDNGFHGSCRLLTNDDSVNLEGWTFYNKGNWIEPELWLPIIGQKPEHASYKCYEKISSGNERKLNHESYIIIIYFKHSQHFFIYVFLCLF